MEEILILFLQALLEIVLQILGGGVLDLLSWTWVWDDEVPWSRRWTMGMLAFAAGCLLGWLSLALVPRAQLPWGWLRVLNLAIGPAVSAWMSWRLAHWRQRHGREMDPPSHAVIAGLACLGLVLVRFVGCVRG